jgi:hypothetical protein
VYSPTTTRAAVFELSRKIEALLAVPLVLAVYWNASAAPAVLSSLLASVFWSPTSNVGAGAVVVNVKLPEAA